MSSRQALINIASGWNNFWNENWHGGLENIDSSVYIVVDLLLTGMFKVFKSDVFEHRKNHTFFFDQLHVQRQI